MNLSGSSLEECGLDKKRTVILLRSVVTISLSYLVLFARTDPSPSNVIYVAAVILSNIILIFLPGDVFRRPLFSKVLFLGDTGVVLVGLYYTVGLSQDFLIVYFFTMFLTAAVETVAQIAIGALLVSIVYGCWLWTTSAVGLGAAEWLRLPFFFIVAVFYAYMTEEVRRERDRRLQAERESQHLRFLLNLSDAFSVGSSGHDVVGQVCGVVAKAFPRLTCTFSGEPVRPETSGTRWFPIRVPGASFGGLRVTTRDETALSPDEEQFCRVVALVVANTLQMIQQTEVAGSSARRLKEEFLGTLSHELRTPLHAILGYIEMLEGVLPPSVDELARESVARLRANTSRLQLLLEEMLWFAELRSGERSVQTEHVDLRAVFERFTARMNSELAGRPIRFESRVAADVPPLETDARKVNQILSGLLSNAAKFTQRGSIELTARCVPGEQIEIAVRDTGIGIDPQDFPLIFEDFRQLDASLTRRAGGLGLGLALAQELAVILGGRIIVESQRNRGATFRVTFPVRQAQRASETLAPESAESSAVNAAICPALA